MSYILDALKKSEEKRPPGPVPDLFTVQGPLLPPARRSPWRLILTITLLLGAVGLGVWIGVRSGRRPVAVEAAAVAPTASRPAAAAVPESPPFAARVRETALPPAPPPAALRVPNTPVASRRAPALPVPAAQTAAAIPPAPPESKPVLPAAAPSPIASTPEPAPSPPPAAELTSPPPDGRIIDLVDLPATVRTEIKDLRLSGHIWSEDPTLRRVMIQDRLLREGAEAGPGLRLEEITAAGAVLSYRGYRFHVGGF